MDEAKLKELKEQHPEGALLRSANGKHEAFFRRPPRADYKRFIAQAFDDRKKPEALERLCRACVVHPDVAGLDAMLEDAPALAEAFGEQLVEMAGGGKAERVG